VKFWGVGNENFGCGGTISPAYYADRLRLCRACSQLQYGTTCSHSGCLVQVIAKQEYKQCPSPQAPAW